MRNGRTHGTGGDTDRDSRREPRVETPRRGRDPALAVSPEDRPGTRPAGSRGARERVEPGFRAALRVDGDRVVKGAEGGGRRRLDGRRLR